jgi:hypothetical protein
MIKAYCLNEYLLNAVNDGILSDAFLYSPPDSLVRVLQNVTLREPQWLIESHVPSAWFDIDGEIKAYAFVGAIGVEQRVRFLLLVLARGGWQHRTVIPLVGEAVSRFLQSLQVAEPVFIVRSKGPDRVLPLTLSSTAMLYALGQDGCRIESQGLVNAAEVIAHLSKELLAREAVNIPSDGHFPEKVTVSIMTPPEIPVGRVTTTLLPRKQS